MAAPSLRRGQDAEVEAVLAGLAPVIRRYLAVRLDWLRDPGDAAADVTQEVLLRVWRHLPRCRARTERQLTAWVRAIARRALLDVRRAREPIGGGVPLPELAIDDGAADADADGPVPAAPDLSALMAHLPPGQRLVVERRLFGGESWSMIATALGTTPGAVRRRYARAVAALRRLVTGHDTPSTAPSVARPVAPPSG